MWGTLDITRRCHRLHARMVSVPVGSDPEVPHTELGRKPRVFPTPPCQVSPSPGTGGLEELNWSWGGPQSPFDKLADPRDLTWLPYCFHASNTPKTSLEGTYADDQAASVEPYTLTSQNQGTCMAGLAPMRGIVNPSCKAGIHHLGRKPRVFPTPPCQVSPSPGTGGLEELIGPDEGTRSSVLGRYAPSRLSPASLGSWSLRAELLQGRMGQAYRRIPPAAARGVCATFQRRGCPAFLSACAGRNYIRRYGDASHGRVQYTPAITHATRPSVPGLAVDQAAVPGS